MTTLNQKITSLAITRLAIARSKAQLKEIQAEFESRPEVQELTRNIQFLTEHETSLSNEIREEALTSLDNLPAGIKPRAKTEVQIDYSAALEWAKVNMPIAIIQKLDDKMITDYAKKNKPAWAQVTTTTQITIATDLSDYASTAEVG